MTDDQVLALLVAWTRLGHGSDRSQFRPERVAMDTLIWAKTEGMADVDRAVREWHDAKRAKERPKCPECGGSGHFVFAVRGGPPERAPCPSCDGSGAEGGPTYEENHIGVPDGLPRTGRSD